ncbi:MAG: hypothetical protein QHH13_05005 [Melioribacter sp.]|uniref:hypothetical protein n=1 Tax=Rosettibacter primus TaxID=3111523 RepID=UPI00247D9E53|nr:hypothetical protein [Melioribacter sp.]
MKKLFFLFLVSSTIFSQIPQRENFFELRLQLLRNNSEKMQNESFSQANFEKISYNYLVELKEKKSPALGILFSMLIPGMGELYANNYESGKYFTITDGVLWGVFAGFNIYGKWKEDNYKSFAQSKGGVNLEGKDSDYFATIGIYISVDEYNRIKELNREFYNVYDPNTNFWKWESENQRKEYRQMWFSSEQAYNNLRFAIGALILNRLISAINAVRLISAYNKNISSEVSWVISSSTNSSLPATISINFKKSF